MRETASCRQASVCVDLRRVLRFAPVTCAGCVRWARVFGACSTRSQRALGAFARCDSGECGGCGRAGAGCRHSGGPYVARDGPLQPPRLGHLSTQATCAGLPTPSSDSLFAPKRTIRSAMRSTMEAHGSSELREKALAKRRFPPQELAMQRGPSRCPLWTALRAGPPFSWGVTSGPF